MKVDTAGIIYVAYERLNHIYFTKSTNGGSGFLPAILVVDSAGLSFAQEGPSLAVNNKGQVFIAWVDQRTDPQSVFVAASYNSGSTFTPNMQVSDSGSYIYSNDIAVDDVGHVYVVWPKFVTVLNLPLCLARSDDSGWTFSYRTVVSDLPVDTGQVYALQPSMSLGQAAEVGITWQDRRFNQYTLRFSRSLDHGQTFSPSVRVESDSDWTGVSSPSRPSLTWKNGSFYLAWEEGRIQPPDSDYIFQILFSYRPDGGQNFVTDKAVFSGGELQSLSSPGLAVNEEGRAFVSWIDDRYDPNFQLRWHLFGAAGIAALQKGDLNLSGQLTPADVVLEINAVFLGQPYPAPFETGDSNCDGGLTPADVVIHLNVTFLGGNFPCS